MTTTFKGNIKNVQSALTEFNHSNTVEGTNLSQFIMIETHLISISITLVLAEVIGSSLRLQLAPTNY